MNLDDFFLGDDDLYGHLYLKKALKERSLKRPEFESESKVAQRSQRREVTIRNIFSSNCYETLVCAGPVDRTDIKKKQGNIMRRLGSCK